MISGTISCFSKLIILQTFFCVNRSYLVFTRKEKIICNLVYYSIIIFLLTINIYAFNNIENINFSSAFKYFLIFNLINIALSARTRRLQYKKAKLIDEKCGLNEEYLDTLKKKVKNASVFIVVSFITDAIGMKALNMEDVDVITNSIAFAAQDCELVLIALIIEGMNLRLSKLKDVSPSEGSRVYRHVVMTAAWVNEGYAPMILLLLNSILMTTIAYLCLLLSVRGTTIIIAVCFREIKSLYYLKKVCHATYMNDDICNKLTLHLAKKLVFDLANSKNTDTYEITHRWYSTILNVRPSYATNSMISIGLSTPLQLLDSSVNYMLVIMQIYMAYK